MNSEVEFLSNFDLKDIDTASESNLEINDFVCSVQEIKEWHESDNLVNSHDLMAAD